jgi:hypothetical protein
MITVKAGRLRTGISLTWSCQAARLAPPPSADRRAGGYTAMAPQTSAVPLLASTGQPFACAAASAAGRRTRSGNRPLRTCRPRECRLNSPSRSHRTGSLCRSLSRRAARTRLPRPASPAPAPPESRPSGRRWYTDTNSAIRCSLAPAGRPATGNGDLTLSPANEAGSERQSGSAISGTLAARDQNLRTSAEREQAPGCGHPIDVIVSPTCTSGTSSAAA